MRTKLFAHTLSPFHLLIWIVVAACGGGDRGGDDERGGDGRGPRASIDELQILKHTPRTCSAASDCPSGSHCDEEAGRCRWACYADSDCGDDARACDLDGKCVAKAATAARRDPASGLRTSTVEAQLAADHPTCVGLPLQQKLDALAELSTSPAACFDDVDCPCGAYCSNDATCRFDCTFDAPAQGPFCTPGNVCSPEGRCVLPSGGNDPDVIADLEATPEVVSGNTVPAAVIVQVDLRIRAKIAAHLPRANNVTVGVEVEPRTGGPTALSPRLRCAPGAPLAASCQLPAGWTFGADPDALRSSPRPIWIEIPQGSIPDEWSVTVRSEWADAPVAITVLAQPVVQQPRPTGHFTGTVSWPQAGGEPLRLPVEADVTATHAVLFDPSRVLLPQGHVVLSKNAAEATYFAWLRSDHQSLGPQEAPALLDVDTWIFNPAKEDITSTLRLTHGTGPAPAQLTLAIDRDRDSSHQTCTSGLTCARGTYCNTTVGMCLPGSSNPSSIVADGYVPGGLLFSAQRDAWAPAVSGLRASHPAALSGFDVIGMERAMCFGSTSQTTPGRISSSNATSGNPGSDALCSVPGLALDAPQQVFPYANRTTAVTVNGSGTETFNLLDTCLAELAVTPSTPYTAANLLQPRQCVSLARFMLAMGAPTPSAYFYPQTARKRLENQLTRQWVSLHAMIARGAVQEGEYDETIGGTLDQPMHLRLGQAVDVLEKGWRLLMRNKRTAADDGPAVQQPDYRTLGRPVAHWTMNQYLDGVLPDTEGAHPIRLAGIPSDVRSWQGLQLTNNTGATCRTDSNIALPTRHFSLVAWLAVSGTSNAYDLINKTSLLGDQFRIRIYNLNTDVRRVEVQYLTYNLLSGLYTLAASSSFEIPALDGYYAFVEDGGSYLIHRLNRNTTNGSTINTYAPISSFGGGPRWGSPGRVSIGCNVTQGVVLADEISLWDRPLPAETLQAFSLAYLNANGTAVLASDSLPPRNLTLQASDEQAQGLAVHLVDGLAAHMELISTYVRSERSEMFGECGVGSVGPARTRVRDRVGRALRFATAIENDAKDLVALAGATATAWLPRYNAALRLYAGKRAEVFTQLGLATSCENPLGITDDDLPLYHGTEVGESARFFASSRFLTAQAKEQVLAATTELNLARNAWQQQRASAFQHVLAAAEKTERLRKIEQEYEGTLRRLCGTPATGTLLAAFRANTMSSANCFLKREVPECAGAESMTIKQLPASCLRGEIGEQILAIQGADIDVRIAENTYSRAIDQYDAEMAYCTRREGFQEETAAIQEAHNEHMSKLREKKRTAGFFGGMVKATIGLAIGAATSNPALAMSSLMEGIGLTIQKVQDEYLEDEQDAEAAHQLVMQKRAAALDLMACFHGADNQKFAIDGAEDVIVRAFHNTKGATVRLENQQTELKALINQAIGDLDFEAQMVRVLPHHHYWVDDHIDAYRRHFRYAQRLTYLALRAFEYESQQSLGLGNGVLAARIPAPLSAAILALEQRTAPMQGEQGFVVGEFAPVMSLRDDLLRLGTQDAPPGFPQLSATEALRAYLASDASKIYSNGAYLGRGIRFSLRPQPWAQFSCAERIWRITTALQVEGSPINNARLLLWQENSFGSQRCRSYEHDDLTLARIRPEKNLLVDDGGNYENGAFVRPQRYTAMETTGLGNKSREELENLSDGLHSGFSGRGLYANYVLLFPSLQFDNPTFLSIVKDVLIRVDLVEVTDTNGDPDQ